MAERLADTIRFYELLDRLAMLVGGPRFLQSCHGKMDWPQRGVYFFYEGGESRSGTGDGQRVVRVGTHGLKIGSQSTLWSRLSQHRGEGPLWDGTLIATYASSNWITQVTLAPPDDPRRSTMRRPPRRPAPAPMFANPCPRSA